MTATPSTVLLVDRPGAFRDAVARAASSFGARVHTSDGALDTLGRLALAPDVMLVAEDAGPPGGLSLCRIARRKLPGAAIYLLRSAAGGDAPPGGPAVVSRDEGALAVARRLVPDDRPPPSIVGAQTIEVPAARAGELLLTLGDRLATGCLVLSSAEAEREIFLCRGAIVFARSSRRGERLGAIAEAGGLIGADALERALDRARDRGDRLGEALLDLDLVGSGGLFALLASQLVLQVTEAVDGGPARARFVAGSAWMASTPLLRLSPMAAVLASIARTPPPDVERRAREVAGDLLDDEPLPAAAHAWLCALGVVDPDALLDGAITAGDLRERLAAAAPAHVDGAWASRVALALLRAGAVTLAAPAPAPLDPLRIARTAEGTREVDRAIAAYLAGDVAATPGLDGPAAPATDALIALYLRTKHRAPRAMVDVPAEATPSEVRAAAIEAIGRIDEGSKAPCAAVVSCWAAELRDRLEQLVRALPADAPAARAEVTVEEILASAPSRPKAIERNEEAQRSLRESPPPPSRRRASAKIAEIEALVARGSWGAVADKLAVAARDKELPPGLALLYAIALKERDPERQTRDADAVAIAAVSTMLDVQRGSPLAVLVAKRALRLHPATWKAAPAPKAGVSMLFAIFVAAAVGIAGYVLGQGGPY